MKINVSVSNEDSFHKVYDSILDDEITITEDDAGFGIEETIVAGLVFIYEAALSGITWDVLKQSISEVIKKFENKKRPNDVIRYYVKAEKNDGQNKIITNYEIKTNKDHDSIHLEFPDGTKIDVK